MRWLEWINNQLCWCWWREEAMLIPSVKLGDRGVGVMSLFCYLWLLGFILTTNFERKMETIIDYWDLIWMDAAIHNETAAAMAMIICWQQHWKFATKVTTYSHILFILGRSSIQWQCKFMCYDQDLISISMLCQGGKEKANTNTHK